MKNAILAVVCCPAVAFGQCAGLSGLAEDICRGQQAAQQQQRRLPSDTELHAAYCIARLQHDVSVFESLKALSAEQQPSISPRVEQLMEQKRAALRKLQLYLVPRLPYLEPNALLGAVASADQDREESSKRIDKVKDQFMAEVSKLKAQGLSSEQIDQKLNAEFGVTDPHAIACDNPSWLPF